MTVDTELVRIIMIMSTLGKMDNKYSDNDNEYSGQDR